MLGVPGPSSVQQEYEGPLQRSFPEERDPENRPFTGEIAVRFFRLGKAGGLSGNFSARMDFFVDHTGGNSRLAEKPCMMRGLFSIRLRPTFSGFLT